MQKYTVCSVCACLCVCVCVCVNTNQLQLLHTRRELLYFLNSVPQLVLFGTEVGEASEHIHSKLRNVGTQTVYRYSVYARTYIRMNICIGML